MGVVDRMAHTVERAHALSLEVADRFADRSLTLATAIEESWGHFTVVQQAMAAMLAARTRDSMHWHRQETRVLADIREYLRLQAVRDESLGPSLPDSLRHPLALPDPPESDALVDLFRTPALQDAYNAVMLPAPRPPPSSAPTTPPPPEVIDLASPNHASPSPPPAPTTPVPSSSAPALATEVPPSASVPAPAPSTPPS